MKIVNCCPIVLFFACFLPPVLQYYNYSLLSCSGLRPFEILLVLLVLPVVFIQEFLSAHVFNCLIQSVAVWWITARELSNFQTAFGIDRTNLSCDRSLHVLTRERSHKMQLVIKDSN